MSSGRKAAGFVRIVPRKTTPTTTTPAKEAGVKFQESGEEISEEDDGDDGEAAFDPASTIDSMQKQFRSSTSGEAHDF